MNLARPFKAGKGQGSVCVAQRRLNHSIVATRREQGDNLIPGVETPG